MHAAKVSLLFSILATGEWGCATSHNYAMPPPLLVDRARQVELKKLGGAYSTFEERDTNHDGVVTREEYVFGRSAAYWAFDLDGDDRLSWPEFATFLCAIPEDGRTDVNVFYKSCLKSGLNGIFKPTDTSRDGYIDRTEMRQIGLIGFADRDHCRNGRLTLEEYGHPEPGFRPTRCP